MVNTSPTTQAGTFTRLGAITGMSVGSTLTNTLLNQNPWKGTRRVNLWNDGTVTATYGNRCYTDSDVGNMGQVMVQIPAFYYGVDTTAANTTCWYISDTGADTVANQSGGGDVTFALHPAFMRNGVSQSYAYPAAYEGYYDYVSGTLQSKANVTPTNAQTMTTVRGYANTIGSGWGILTYQTFAALQLMMLIHTGTPYMGGPTYVSVMGNDVNGDGTSGITNLTQAGESHRALPCLTGHTASLGNACGGSDFQTSAADNLVSPDTPSWTYAPSYFGWENPYGNLSEWIDGISSNAGAVYITDHGFVTDSIASPYTLTGLTQAASGITASVDLSQAVYKWTFVSNQNVVSGFGFGNAYHGVYSAGAWNIMANFARNTDYNSIFCMETYTGTVAAAGSRLEYVGNI